MLTSALLDYCLLPGASMLFSSYHSLAVLQDLAEMDVKELVHQVIMKLHPFRLAAIMYKSYCNWRRCQFALVMAAA